MTILHKLYVGLNDKDTKTQLKENEYYEQVLFDIMSNHNIDCTIQNGLGIYSHNDKTKVIENTIIIEIIDFGNFDKDVFEIAVATIKKELNQEAIGYYQIKLDKCELL